MSRTPPPTWKCAITFLVGLAGGERVRRFLFRRLLGYDIHPTAMVGNCFVRVGQLSLGPSAKIGHFTFIRNADRVEIGENARIGTFNWIYGMPGQNDRHFVGEEARKSSFIMKRESSLTSRHIVDCTNLVEIGAFTTVAGFYTQILTHGIDLDPAKQSSAPVIIGDYCMIGTGCILLKGTIIPDRVVIGAGSTVRGQLEDNTALYSGVPASRVKYLDPEAEYFHRQTGPVD
ncbi:MAG: DapH/DapD/GlmU-related protein [Pseudomonadota bacterium]